MTDIKGDMSENWVTISDAAHSLGVTERTIYRRIKEGKIEVKIEDTKRYVKIDPAETITDEESDIMSKDELIEHLKDENKYLRQKLDESQQSKERSDTIIMQLTRHIGDAQKALEMKNMSWWKRLRLKKGNEEDKV